MHFSFSFVYILYSTAVIWRINFIIIGHFGDESLQSVTCTIYSGLLTTKPQQPRDRTNTKHKPMQDKKWPY